MRHVLIFLVASLKYKGVDKFTAIYSEPMFYSNGDNTDFSTTTSSIVKSVSGISSTSNSEFKDHLIINVGYDHKMLSQISSYKDGATYHPFILISIIKCRHVSTKFYESSFKWKYYSKF